jgi:hypothetical protein
LFPLCTHNPHRRRSDAVFGGKTEISQAEAQQITAGLAARYWPPEAAQLPGVACAYPR